MESLILGRVARGRPAGGCRPLRGIYGGGIDCRMSKIALSVDAASRGAMPGTKGQKVAEPDARGGFVRSGLPLFHTDPSGRIVGWNARAEQLTGIGSGEAVGRSCWEVIRGHDRNGGIVCHPGCSVVRLAGQGWPASCADLHVHLPSGVDRLAVSTIVVGAGDAAAVVHPLQVVAQDAAVTAPSVSAPDLTPRQREVLGLLADGVRAEEIATRLSLSVPTVRNHIYALLRRLGVNSQLAAVARAHELGLCDGPNGGSPPQR